MRFRVLSRKDDYIGNSERSPDASTESVRSPHLDSQALTVLSRTEQYLSVQQIQQLLPEEGSLQGVRKSVARLAEQGIVLELTVGQRYAYSLNFDHLLADAVKIIADAKNELITRMHQIISEWQTQPLTVKIFGSAARNEMLSSSDIDILIVMPDSAAEVVVNNSVQQLVTKATLWTGNDVRPLVYRNSEVEPASIFNSILSDGIDIAGDPSWLRKHAQGHDHQNAVLPEAQTFAILSRR